MKWHVYEIEPVDIGWEHLMSVEDTASVIGQREGAARARGTPPVLALDDFLALWGSAQAAAGGVRQLTGLRRPPVVLWLPGAGEFAPGFVIKEDANGLTHVVSPVPLPHLGQ